MHAKPILLALLRKVLRALRTWPDGRAWFQSFLIFLGYGALTLALGLAFKTLRFELYDGDFSRLVQFSAIALIVPCLTEELFFRVLLLPDPSLPVSTRYRNIRVGIALVLFVLWHPLNGMWMKTAARQLFLDPGFLLLATLLGACCSVLYLRTKSIWPSTLVHWLTLIYWKAFLGGRIF